MPLKCGNTKISRSVSDRLVLSGWAILTLSLFVCHMLRTAPAIFPLNPFLLSPHDSPQVPRRPLPLLLSVHRHLYRELLRLRQAVLFPSKDKVAVKRYALEALVEPLDAGVSGVQLVSFHFHIAVETHCFASIHKNSNVQNRFDINRQVTKGKRNGCPVSRDMEFDHFVWLGEHHRTHASGIRKFHCKGWFRSNMALKLSGYLSKKLGEEGKI
jgi:hypothetical protein